MNEKVKIVAEITLKPNTWEVMKPIFDDLITNSQAEAGCISYDLHIDITDTTNTKFVMLETWKDQTAIDLHNESAHFTTFNQVAADYIANIKVIFLRMV